MDLDAPKSQNLSKIIGDIWAQYVEPEGKKQEELDKYWSLQIEERTQWLSCRPLRWELLR